MFITKLNSILSKRGTIVDGYGSILDSGDGIIPCSVRIPPAIGVRRIPAKRTTNKYGGASPGEHLPDLTVTWRGVSNSFNWYCHPSPSR